MVLADLGSSISKALRKMGSHTLVDQTALDACIKEITTALMQADVDVMLAVQLRKNLLRKVNLEEMAAGHNPRKLIEKAVFEELCTMLDGGEPFQPKKGRPNVVMFVGLQGNGKTTTCTKYAYHYKRKGFRPALICADTYRAGAYDQLKQNATKANIQYYGSYTETDPVKVAAEGVARFKENKNDLIIVDTSGRHKQEEALFEEMRQLEDAVMPDNVCFVLDGSMGQAVKDQAKAFKESVKVGSVIVTKLDGHAKGGGALSAVSATQSPITFIGTGEHMDEFEAFETKGFVSKLLGWGDVSGFLNKIQEALPENGEEEMMRSLDQGKFTMRQLYEQFATLQKMGPMSQVLSMFPGMSNMLPDGMNQEGAKNMERYMTIMDSMTDEELDASDPRLFKDKSRVLRLARGAGMDPSVVVMLITQYEHMAKMMSKMKGAMGMGRGGRGNPMVQKQNMQQVAGMLPPGVLAQIGGAGALEGLMKQMAGGGGLPGMPPGMF